MPAQGAAAAGAGAATGATAGAVGGGGRAPSATARDSKHDGTAASAAAVAAPSHARNRTASTGSTGSAGSAAAVSAAAAASAAAVAAAVTAASTAGSALSAAAGGTTGRPSVPPGGSPLPPTMTHTAVASAADIETFVTKQPAIVPFDPAAHKNGTPFDDQTLAELKEVFALFDYAEVGTIATDDLGTCLRGLGRNLTEEQIHHFINVYDKDGSGRLDFATFHRLVAENEPSLRGPATEEAVLEAFKVFDLKRDGHVDAADLVHLLRNLGEPLTADDVDNLLREIEIDGDRRVNINDFVKHMFRTSVL